MRLDHYVENMNSFKYYDGLTRKICNQKSVILLDFQAFEEKPCLNSNARDIWRPSVELYRIAYKTRVYVRLHNPSSTALPIMVCAEINAGH